MACATADDASLNVKWELHTEARLLEVRKARAADHTFHAAPASVSVSLPVLAPPPCIVTPCTFATVIGTLPNVPPVNVTPEVLAVTRSLPLVPTTEIAFAPAPPSIDRPPVGTKLPLEKLTVNVSAALPPVSVSAVDCESSTCCTAPPFTVTSL